MDMGCCMMSRFLSYWMLVGLLACTNAAWAESKTITFIHFNDLHAHLTPHADVVPDAQPGQSASTTKIVTRGGLARTATVIKRIRAQNPNSVLMNIGDTYHGGVEALFTNGNAIVDPVNALGIDVGVPGNWDFAYGPMVTRLRYFDTSQADLKMLGRMASMFMPDGDVKRPNFPNLAANMTYSMPPRKAGKNPLQPTMLKQIGGVSVGFIGITSDIVPMMYGPLAMGLNFVQGEVNYKNLIQQHARTLRKQGANVVVVMSELGIQKDYRLAQIMEPGLVDVFFSAHTHEATFEPLKSASGALVVEAGNDGYVGQMDVVVNAGKVIARNWKLMPVGSDIPEDAIVKKLVDTARAPFLVANPNLSLPMPILSQRLTQSIATVVGRSAGPLDRRHALESTFNDVFAEALRHKAGTQLALSPGFRFDAVIGRPGGVPMEDNTVAQDNITLEDVYRFFPVSYTLATGKVTGKRIKEIMEDTLTHVYSPNVFKQGGGWFDGVGGLTGTINLSRPDGQRVLSLVAKDKKQTVHDQDVFSIVGCTRPMEGSGVLCSYDGFTGVTPLLNPATGEAWTIADIFVDMLARSALPKASGRNFNEISGERVWPQVPFVQPLAGVGVASANPVAGDEAVLPELPQSASQKKDRPMLRMMRQRMGLE